MPLGCHKFIADKSNMETRKACIYDGILSNTKYSRKQHDNNGVSYNQTQKMNVSFLKKINVLFLVGHSSQLDIYLKY